MVNKQKAKLEDIKQDFIDHKIPLDELVLRLNSNIETGLTSEVAQEIFDRNGPNALKSPKVTPQWVKFCKNLFGGFAVLLWIGSILCYIAFAVSYFGAGNKPHMDELDFDNLYLGIVLMVVVIITGCFQYYQEGKSSKIIDSFKNMIPPLAVVRRNGEKAQISAEQLVIGDIVEVKGGDRIPADIRIIQARSFKVDNSSLTGESEPLSRKPECTSDNPLETHNLAFYSTNAVEGVAVGIVIQIGDNTVMGKIAHLTSGLERGKTPIAREIDHFIHIITGVAFFIGISMFIVSVSAGEGLLKSVVFFISMIVANVPEGLIATVCVCLSLTAKRMAKQHCLVKNLEAVETLGSTSTICSDKTGTLTQNHMTVSHIWRDLEIKNIHMFHNIMPEQQRNMIQFNDAETALVRIAALCNRADFKPNQDDVHLLNRKCIGDASEVALLQYAEVQVNGVAAYRQKNPKLAEIPFNSTNKYQVSVHDIAEDDMGFMVVMKGAPERIFARCATILVNGVERPIDNEILREFNEAYHHLGSKGERVLGFCDMHLDQKRFPFGFKFHSEEPNFPLDGLRFVGLISMIDPPREGVAHSVLLCQQAGIQVVMVTGDHPVTAQAIATKVHIIKRTSKVAKLVSDDQNFASVEAEVKSMTQAIVVHGEQLTKLKPEQLDFIVTNFDQVVFSRTSPAQKLSIVEAYQRCGKIVAVTGDGVNDAPALRKADIGIAMGMTGTEVSKQAADMILMNDNFASIVIGIEEGRIIFDNLKKSIAYTLTSNIPEITPFLFNILLGIPLPMTVIGILCIDLGTDLLPAIALAYEGAESDIMRRPPRDSKHDQLVNWRTINFAYLQIGMLQALAAYATYFWIMYEHGFYPSKLWGIRSTWDARNGNVTDSFGHEWSYADRKTLEKCCNSAYFFAVVVVQWVDLLISKTRMNSLLTQRLTNQVLNVSLVLTVLITVVIIYTPYLNTMLHLTGLRLRWTLIPVPFACLIFFYDETRRYFIRNYPKGFAKRFTYY